MSNFHIELSVVMQYLALKDQCQNLASQGYSTNFCLQKMTKFERMLKQTITTEALKKMLEDV